MTDSGRLAAWDTRADSPAVTAKSLLDEQADSFGGWYGGNNSLDPVKADIESADLVLHIGAMKSDTNTGRFTLGLPLAGTIEFYSDTTKIGAAEFPGTDMRHLVPALVPLLAAVGKPPAELATAAQKVASGTLHAATHDVDGGAVISQRWLWPRMAGWFQDGDVILADMGTSCFGSLPTALPSDSQYHSQCMWGAIVGALVGPS